MRISSVLVLIMIAVVSCNRDEQKDDNDSALVLKRSATEYFRATAGAGDPFDLRDFRIEGDSAFITVSYPGGCKKHSFEVIWSETYIKTNPPETGLIVIHESNEDMCEAYITETLAFFLPDLTGPAAMEDVVVNMLSGAAPHDSMSVGGWDPPSENDLQINFPQGEVCQVEVTAATVICGAGLYENLWLALNDSVNTGNNSPYFRKWLQPVALDAGVKNFIPVPGKKYIIGARIQESHPYNEVIVCLAYSGPSVPVRITCVTELK